MQAIVTIKIDKRPGHDPSNKQIGMCSCSNTCTDMTGQHHSYVEEGDTLEEIEKKAKKKYSHVTRIEVIKMSVKNEKEIREQIHKITDSYKHVLDCYPATVGINAPRALMQMEAQSKLDALYWTLGEKRPRFKCDDTTKVDG